jgi:hypothetical protein
MLIIKMIFMSGEEKEEEDKLTELMEGKKCVRISSK